MTWQTGSHSVGVKVSDGKGGSANQSFTVNVYSNRPPVFTSTPVTSGVVGQAYSYTVKATDPDGDKVTFLLDKKPYGMTIDATTGLISWKPYYSGSFTVSVRAKDSSSASAVQTFTLTVAKSGTSGGGGSYTAQSVIAPENSCDISGDGFLTLDDVNMIMAGVGTNDPRLDVDGDGRVTVNDVRKCALEMNRLMND
jgi:hypothetical protein